MTEIVLRLYIAGRTASSRQAEIHLLELQKFLRGNYKIEVVDVLTNPELAESAGILATPTLAYEHPQNPRRVIGDFSDTQRVLKFLGIKKSGEQ